MGVTAKEMKEYAEGRRYTNWYEFRKDAGYNAAREALKQIKLEKK